MCKAATLLLNIIFIVISLKKNRIVLSVEANKIVFKIVWDKFYKKLEKLEVKIIKNNKVKWQRFSKSEAVEIINFFFANIIRPNAIIYF